MLGSTVLIPFLFVPAMGGNDGDLAHVIQVNMVHNPQPHHLLQDLDLTLVSRLLPQSPLQMRCIGHSNRMKPLLKHICALAIIALAMVFFSAAHTTTVSRQQFASVHFSCRVYRDMLVSADFDRICAADDLLRLYVHCSRRCSGTACPSFKAAVLHTCNLPLQLLHRYVIDPRLLDRISMHLLVGKLSYVCVDAVTRPDSCQGRSQIQATKEFPSEHERFVVRVFLSKGKKTKFCLPPMLGFPS